ncbi:MAG: type II toxin-antitoxin system Phd/YefM family antitoxin [Candidatus Latescibacteria bacterium]|nr:type II toxin-antitoxin system Phd/YefM family antitoxin [Candidatus Latescibacterota bacterium]
MLRKTLTEARKDLPEIFNRVCYAGERAIIQKHGKDCVAVVPIEDLKVLERIEDMSDIRDARAALKEAENGDNISFDEFVKELGLYDKKNMIHS